MKRVYVGNLPYAVTEKELKELFGQHGKIFEAKIQTDRHTGRPLGYAFVLLDDQEAPSIVQALNGFLFGGRQLRVNETKDHGRAPSRTGDRSSRRDSENDGYDSFRPRKEFREDDEEDLFRPQEEFREDDGIRRSRREFCKSKDGEFRPRREFRKSKDGEFRPDRERSEEGWTIHSPYQENHRKQNGKSHGFRSPRRFKRENDGNMTDSRREYDEKDFQRKNRRNQAGRSAFPRRRFDRPRRTRGKGSGSR